MINKGSFGTVYAAKSNQNEEMIALKISNGKSMIGKTLIEEA